VSFAGRKMVLTDGAFTFALRDTPGCVTNKEMGMAKLTSFVLNKPKRDNLQGSVPE
jgi:hypothetical protein